MQLALSTWHEVEEYLRHSRGIIIPVGSTEQHGPNGLIGTDHLDAEFVAKGVGDKIAAMVGPTLAYGMSQHHLGFAGSVTLRPSTMIAMVGDIVHSLVRHGFERFFFINFDCAQTNHRSDPPADVRNAKQGSPHLNRQRRHRV